MPSFDLRNIEKEFWARLDIESINFVGGSLGKYKGGVEAMAISNNSRLLAIAINNGNICIYDMIYQSKLQEKDDEVKHPYLIRIATGIKSPVARMEFSTDSYSQILVVFEDGTARVYNVHQPGSKLIEKSRYARKEQLKKNLIFSLEERFNLNSNF